MLLSAILILITATPMLFESFDSDESTTLGPEDFMGLDSDPEILFAPSGTPEDLEFGSLFEGDIAGISDIQTYVKENNDIARNAIKQKYLKWENGVIPYTISKKYDKLHRRYIAKAFDEYHKKTCVRFVPRNPKKHPDYISIRPTGKGCFSGIGRWGKEQEVSLDDKCLNPGTVMHELMHVTGFFHEHSRNDRDKWIKIIWANVEKDKDDNFEKFSLDKITHLGEPYDYNSVMHYSSTAFSRNGKDTVIPKKNGGKNIGQRERDHSQIT